MQSHIVVAGSINMDFVIRTPHHPQLGETVIGGSFQTFPGGKGANQSVAAARAGASVILIGRIGKDSFGSELTSILNQDGIDTSYVQIDPEITTGVAFIIIDDTTGQNNIVLAEGANGRLSPEHIDAAKAAFNGASLFTFNLECPMNALENAVFLAKQNGARIVLNPAPFQTLPQTMLSNIDYLIPNQIEVSSLLGESNLEGDISKIIDKVGQMQDKGVLKDVIVTLGSDGALVIENGKGTHLPAYPVKAVDTVAAGDAFVGAFSTAINEGLPLLEAARWGNAAGALAVTKHGAQPSLPTRKDLERFLNAG